MSMLHVSLISDDRKQMSLAFQLLLPRKVVFGLGKRSELGSLASCLGRRAFLIDGSRTLHDSPFWIEILEPLRTAGIVVEHIATASREPTIADVDETANHVRRLKPHSGDFLIGLGGGSAMDLAKAVSAMATNTKSPTVRDYLEGVGTGLSLTNPPLPMLAIPTTAGTGTEATKNAVISVDAPPVKKSLRSEQMVPAAVLIDPELTVPNSPAQTAASGMDAITQLLESFFSRRSQPVTDALCLDGLVKALPAIESAYQNGSDLAARSAMSYAAFLSGVALANSGLGMAHGVAAALGAINDVPHGLACAVMLPVTLKTNEAVILEKVSLLNRHLEANGLPGDILGTISQLSRSLAIPEKLRDLGVQQEQLPAIVAGSRGNSMSGNPRDLTDQELTQILEAAW